MASNTKQSDEENGLKIRSGSRLHGLSRLEALFVGLGVAAFIIGSALHAYFDTKQDKLDRLIENSQAVGQWLQAAYLLSQSTGQTSIGMCDIGKTRSGEACVSELISRNDVLLSLKNPFFSGSESASVFAIFEGEDSLSLAGKPCSHLADKFTIVTSAGTYHGKPSFWRGTIVLSFQEVSRQFPKHPHRLIVGYCDGGGRYQPSANHIPFG